jgi:cytidylate kinase
MYRSIGLKADALGVALDDDDSLEALCRATEIGFGRAPDGSPRVTLDGEDVTLQIREHRVSELASRVSARRPVRDAMTRFQRRLGEAAPSVLEGRDIGTVVFPGALVKVFLTASVEERARRRCEELRGRGQSVGYEDVLADIRRRDASDSSREYAPLRAAGDAVRLDTSGMSIDEAVEAVTRLVRDALEVADRDSEKRGD